MTTPQLVLEEVRADNPNYCVISNADNECCTTQQLPPLPKLPSFDESSTTDFADQLTSTSYYPDNTTLDPDDKTRIIVLSCFGFVVLAVALCVISYYVYRSYKRKKQTSLTVTPANGHSPSPAAERRSGTFHNPDGNFVELYPATKPAWEGNDNDGYQSDSEVNGNGGNGDSGVVVSPKPEMNGTEETKEDNKPKKKQKKKKKKAPDLNQSLIERPPSEKKTNPTEVIM